jgi:flagellar protein FlaG
MTIYYYKKGFKIFKRIFQGGNDMKINSNQVNSNVNSAAWQSASSKAQGAKPDKVPKHIRDAANKTVSESGSELNVDERKLIEAIQKTNQTIKGATCNFEYSIHEKTKQIMVKVIDIETKDVIKEFPPEKILDMVAKMWEVAGIMVDERR